MNPAPWLEVACNDVRQRMQKAIELLHFAADGQGKFISAVDTYVRMHLAADQLEEALKLMRRHVLPKVVS
jgi:hypothetical protein